MHGPKGWSRTYQRRLLVSDIFVILLIMVTAQAIRFGWNSDEPVAGPSAPPYGFVSLAIAALWIAMLAGTRSREARILGHGPQEFQRVVAASWYTFSIIAIVGFLTQWQISRGYLLFALPAGTVVLLAYRAAWRMWIHSKRDAGELQAQVLVVGPLGTSETMIRRLRGNLRAGYHVIGLCVPPSNRGELSNDLDDIPVLGTIEGAVAIAAATGAEYILLSGTDALSLQEARRIGWDLEGTGIGLIVAPAMVDVAGPRVSVSPVEGLPLLHVDPATFSGAKYVMKSATDRVVSALSLVLLAIPMLVIAVIIKSSSRGPVLFAQERIGQNGEPFRMLKFRSMDANAEARLIEVMGDDIEVFYKAKDDPRVTRFGRFMRRFSVDELPQLMNVFKGDMSLVGPRPQIRAEVAQYSDIASRRLLVKPGMTGLWQVSGRSELSADESIRLDAYYTENWSLGGDILIILRTVVAVFGHEGAY